MKENRVEDIAELSRQTMVQHETLKNLLLDKGIISKQEYSKYRNRAYQQICSQIPKLNAAYLEKIIKDKKVLKSVKKLVECNEICPYFNDVESMVSKAKAMESVSGNVEEVVKGIKNPKKVKGILIYAETPKDINLDDFGAIAEKITKPLKDNTDVLWGVKKNKALKETKLEVVLIY